MDLSTLRFGSQWRSLGQRLSRSLWLVPMGSVVMALILGVVLPRLDERWHGGQRAWYLYAGQPDSARELLSTIATAMLSLAGLVFSITILVLQLTSSQFSPRVLRTFLEDRTTQVAMGLFLGSFVYPMVLLPQVRSGDEEFVPALSVVAAVLLVLLSVLMFVRYIHHMANSIRAVEILARVAEETHAAIARMYPDVGEDPLADGPLAPARAADLLVCNETRGGVVTAVDEQYLFRLACNRDLVIVVHPYVGDFVPKGAAMLSIFGQRPPPAEELQGSVVVEKERTPQQDVAFGFRQLVDVAERALSPSLNDPTTAVQALNYVHDLLRTMARRKFPSSARVDDEGRLRLVLPRPDWSSYVHLGLDEIRHYGGSSIQVARRMRAVISDLLSVAPPSRSAPLLEQQRLLDAGTARDFVDPAERRLARTPSAQGHGVGRNGRKSL